MVWTSPIVLVLLNPVSKKPSVSQKSQALGLISSTAKKSFSPSVCCAHSSMYFRNFLPFPRLRAHGPSIMNSRYGSPVVGKRRDRPVRPESLLSRNRPSRRDAFRSQFGWAVCREFSRPLQAWILTLHQLPIVRR